VHHDGAVVFRLSSGVLDTLAVAMMRFAVDDDDILHSHQLGHDTLEHLALGFERLEFLGGFLLGLPSFDRIARAF
jgi:hypothetical protein